MEEDTEPLPEIMESSEEEKENEPTPTKSPGVFKGKLKGRRQHFSRPKKHGKLPAYRNGPARVTNSRPRRRNGSSSNSASDTFDNVTANLFNAPRVDDTNADSVVPPAPPPSPETVVVSPTDAVAQQATVPTLPSVATPAAEPRSPVRNTPIDAESPACDSTMSSPSKQSASPKASVENTGIDPSHDSPCDVAEFCARIIRAAPTEAQNDILMELRKIFGPILGHPEWAMAVVI